MLTRLAKLQAKYTWLFAIGIIGIYFFLFLIAQNLEIDPSFDVLVPEDSEFNTNNKKMRASFEQNDALLLLVQRDATSIVKNAPDTLSDERVQNYISELTQTLGQSEYVIDISQMQVDESDRFGRIVLSLNTPTSSDGYDLVQEQINGLLAEVGEPVGIKTTLTGLPVLLNSIVILLINDNLNTILITIGIIFLLLYFYARDLVFTVSILTPPILSLIALAAVMVLANVSVTLTLAAVGVLVLGLGADYSIHIFIHYRKARREHAGPKEALVHTVEDLQKPITASFVTTLAGFAALMFGVSPSSQAQGLVLGVAITLIFINTFLLFPVLILILDKYMHLKENLIFKKVKSFLAKFALFQARRAWYVIGFVVVMTLVMFYGMTQVQFSTSDSNWIPDSNPIAKSLRESTYVFGDQESITIILEATQGDLRNPQFARDVQNLESSLVQLPRVDSISSAYTDVSLTSDDLFTNLTAATAYFNSDYTLTVIQLSSQNFGITPDGRTETLVELRQLMETKTFYHATASLYGDAVRFEELSASLEKDAGFTTMIGLALVFLVATLIYASFRVGLLALGPIIIAVIWSIGLMGFFKVPFTSLSTGIISLVLGVGVDFSIHLVDGMLKRLKTLGLEGAISETLITSGSAILLSSLTTMTGFFALTFAQLLGTQRLGLSLMFSIFAVLIVSLTLVPAIISLTSKKYQLQTSTISRKTK